MRIDSSSFLGKIFGGAQQAKQTEKARPALPGDSDTFEGKRAPEKSADKPKHKNPLQGLFEGIGNVFKGIGEGLRKLSIGIGALFGLGATGFVENAARALDGTRGKGDRPDLDNDGRESSIKSAADKTGKPPVIYVGGALTPFAGAEAEAALLSRATGRNVNLVHNATNLPSDTSDVAAFGARAADDLKQIVDDHLGRRENAAASVVKEQILEQLEAGQPVELAGYSAGAGIIARAVNDARAEFAAEHGEREATEAFKNVKVLNIAGVVKRDDFPLEIQYEHVEQRGDPVAELLGERSEDFPERFYEARARLIPRGFLDDIVKGRTSAHAPLSSVLGGLRDDGESNGALADAFL